MAFLVEEMQSITFPPSEAVEEIILYRSKGPGKSIGLKTRKNRTSNTGGPCHSSVTMNHDETPGQGKTDRNDFGRSCAYREPWPGIG